MKKAFALFLALCMVFALCACGQTAAPAQTETPAEPQTETPAEAPAADHTTSRTPPPDAPRKSSDRKYILKNQDSINASTKFP